MKKLALAIVGIAAGVVLENKFGIQEKVIKGGKDLSVKGKELWKTLKKKAEELKEDVEENIDELKEEVGDK